MWRRSCLYHRAFFSLRQTTFLRIPSRVANVRHFSAKSSYAPVGKPGAGPRDWVAEYGSTLTPVSWSYAQHTCSEIKEAQEKLNTQSAELSQKELVKLSKKVAAGSQLAELADAMHEKRGELVDLYELIADSSGETGERDEEMLEIAQSDADDCKRDLLAMEDELMECLLPPDADDERNAILEVRAGAGGEEGGIFAKDMFRMYELYAGKQGWRWEVLDTTKNSSGGYKEASATISGHDVFGHLRNETGAHRVQRVPATETQGRVHTSVMTVAVLPEAEEVDIEIREVDLEIDTFRSQGAGGQSVNTTDSAVRITHKPTGVSVAMQDERSQHQNRKKAMRVLRSRLFEAKLREEHEQRAAMRQDQVGSGERSERVRTYNFPQGRVTDHRTGSSKFGIDAMMDGELLTEYVEELRKHFKLQDLQDALDDHQRKQEEQLGGGDQKGKTKGKK